ncbi:MAG: glycosyltransferase family 39 protein [Thiobacillaceae bacterium]
MSFQSISASRNDRVMLPLALLLLALLTAVALFARPLTPIDETRYVSVAWEMWLRGDFLVPFKNGEPYSHKPPLMMWMFQAGWFIFGVNEWWPRLVSPLFSAGGLLLTMGLAKRLWPRHSGVGGQAVLILVSSLLWTVFSTSAMFDVMLAFFVLLGMHGTLLAADGKRRGLAWLGLAIGLGVLAKGPVILLQLLPVAVLAPWWNPGLRWTRWYAGLLAAVLLGAAIALAWAIPAGIAGGAEYRNAIFWGQTANRMVESFAHRRPLWWYVPLLPVLLFPWFLWPGLWRAVGHYARQNLDRGGRFCLAWMLPVFVAFSFISGKQVHYLVPLFPAFALFVARAMGNGSEDGVRPGGVWLPAILVATAGVILLMLSQGLVALPHDEFPQLPSIWPGAFMLLAGVTALVLGRRCAQPLILMGLIGAAFSALMQLAIARPLYASYDVRPMAHAIREVQDGGHVVAHIGKYHDQYQFFGRLQQPLVELQGDTPKAWLANHPAAYAVVYVKDTSGLQGTPTIVTQRYRGEVAALLDAQTALRLLATPVALDTQ